jgi:hypothetical protein
LNPPPSSSLAEEKRLHSLLLRAAARDFPTLAVQLFGLLAHRALNPRFSDARSPASAGSRIAL